MNAIVYAAEAADLHTTAASHTPMSASPLRSDDVHGINEPACQISPQAAEVGIKTDISGPTQLEL